MTVKVDKKYQVKGLQVENSNYLDEETEEETVDISQDPREVPRTDWDIALVPPDLPNDTPDIQPPTKKRRNFTKICRQRKSDDFPPKVQFRYSSELNSTEKKTLIQ